MVPKTNRRRKDLVSVGPVTIKDLHLLGITTVEQLAQQDAQDLYTQLCMHMNIQANSKIKRGYPFIKTILDTKNPQVFTLEGFYNIKIFTS